jgi:hypothetical protein
VEPVAAGGGLEKNVRNPIFCKHKIFLQFFEIGEVSNGEWVAQKLIFVQQHHPRHSHIVYAYNISNSYSSVVWSTRDITQFSAKLTLS